MRLQRRGRGLLGEVPAPGGIPLRFPASVPGLAACRMRARGARRGIPAFSAFGDGSARACRVAPGPRGRTLGARLAVRRRHAPPPRARWGPRAMRAARIVSERYRRVSRPRLPCSPVRRRATMALLFQGEVEFLTGGESAGRPPYAAASARARGKGLCARPMSPRTRPVLARRRADPVRTRGQRLKAGWKRQVMVMAEQPSHIHFENTNRWSTRQMVTMALLGAVSAILMFVQIPLIPAATFLTYDPRSCRDGGRARLRPGSGVAVGVVAIVIHALTTGDWVGALMNVVATVCFILPRRSWPGVRALRGGRVAGMATRRRARHGGLGRGEPHHRRVVLVRLGRRHRAPHRAGGHPVQPDQDHPERRPLARGVAGGAHGGTGCRGCGRGWWPMISCRGLRYSYDGAAYALDGLDLDIADGEFVCVLGGNGSGKSTLARHLDALIVPQEGTVAVDGLDTSDPELVYDIRARVGLVFQNPDDQLVATLVEDDVAFGPRTWACRPTRSRATWSARWPRWAWPGSRGARRMRSRAGRSSASPSPACWPCARACWCSTRRRPCSTRAAAAGSCAWCVASTSAG